MGLRRRIGDPFPHMETRFPFDRRCPRFVADHSGTLKSWAMFNFSSHPRSVTGRSVPQVNISSWATGTWRERERDASPSFTTIWKPGLRQGTIDNFLLRQCYISITSCLAAKYYMHQAKWRPHNHIHIKPFAHKKISPNQANSTAYLTGPKSITTTSSTAIR